MDRALSAAARCFPARAKAIENLAARNETFSEICRDFADAQAELAKWEQSDEPVRDQRLTEFRVLVKALAEEIEVAIDRAAIVPFQRPG